jgi:DNA-binding HxlR family transcriptional regulator
MTKTDFQDGQISPADPYRGCDFEGSEDPRVGALVNELIAHVADKWTMIILEVLTARGELRFTRLSEQVPGISYKMLTQTLRMMEREGLIARTIHPVVPPKVEYRLTDLGLSLSAAFCGVWIWAERNLEKVELARTVFDEHSTPPKVGRRSR